MPALQVARGERAGAAAAKKAGAKAAQKAIGTSAEEGLAGAGKKSVNIDTGTANAFISENSQVRHKLKNYVKDKNMFTTETAVEEFNNIVKGEGGALEQSRAAKFLKRVNIIPDNPSTRAMNLQVTKRVGANDKIYLVQVII